MGINPLQINITEGASNNDTVPTLGKVEDMIATVDSWNEVMHLGNTFTILNTENLSATITQNDTTNNPAALIIANTGSGNDITLPNSTYIKNGIAAFKNLQIGSTITTSGADSVAIGNVSTTTGNNAVAMGRFVTAQAYTSVAIGQYNILAGTTTSWVVTDPVFTIGIGLAEGSRVNALEVLKNGKLFTPTVYTDVISTATKVLSIDSAGQIGISTTSSPTFAQVTVDNLKLDGNTLSSSSGNINLSPDNPADDVIINSHWSFDGKTLLAISDSDTTITAYAGKNITVEDVTFDGGVVASVTSLTVDNILLDGNSWADTGTTSLITVSTNINLAAANSVVITSADNNDITITAGLNGKVAIDNVRIFSSTVETAAGDLSLIPVAGAGVIVDSHWKFDANALTSLTDNNTTIAAYAGKNITIESVTFDGGVVAGISSIEVGNITAAANTITTSTGDLHLNSDSGQITTLNLSLTSLTSTGNITSTGGYVNQQGIFAEIYVADASTAQSIATGATYTKSTAFTTNGQSSNCVAGSTDDRITITQTGRYRVSGSCSAISGTANVVWRGAAFLNNVEQSQVHWKRKMATNTDAGDMSFTGFIDVTSVPWDLDFRLRHDNGGAIDFTIEYANLNVEYIGST